MRNVGEAATRRRGEARGGSGPLARVSTENMTEVNVLLLQAHGMMSHPMWFKIGGFRLRDFRAALEIEEQTLATVNRQVQLQLNRLREEYDVLKRRKAKLDSDRETARGVTSPGGPDGPEEHVEVPPEDQGEAPDKRTTPAARKRRPEKEPEHRTEKEPRRKAAIKYKCGYCGKSSHNARTCPDKKR